MSYKFGVSYNCKIGADDSVGDGASLDYVGNSLAKIYQTIEGDDKILVTEGEYIGQRCNMGGKVVAYFGYDEDGDGFVYPTIVIFENPTLAVVIEE